MISVQEATSIVLSHLRNPHVDVVPVDNAGGRILAEEIIADRDLPPFDRVTMDGIAISAAAFSRGVRAFKIEAIMAAGQPGITLQDNNACIEIMTGAMLPAGTDVVIPYEEITITDGVAHVTSNEVHPKFIHTRGMDATNGQSLLSPGLKITSADIALLASVGKSQVRVFAFPKTAIISTGDELVNVAASPLPHQIRRSNAHALLAAIKELKGDASLFHVSDHRDKLETALRDILRDHELIILSGGVSKGKFDHIPDVLAQLGVQKHFHQVSQRPGKPFWFGTSESNTVFALPGNPVSTFMCFYRYVKPWIVRSMGLTAPVQHAILAKDFEFQPALTYFLQVKIQNEHGKLMAWPDAGGGSGDFANLKDVSGFLELPAGEGLFREGSVFPFWEFRN